MASKNRRQEIRDVFTELGGAGIRRLVEVLRNRGFYDAEAVEHYAYLGMAANAKAALVEKNVPGALPGLRFAYPDQTDEDEGADEDRSGPTWKQLTLFDYAGVCGILKRHGKGVLDDYEELVRLRDYCVERFGRAPEIVEVVAPADMA